MKPHSNKRAFTLVELLIVIAVITVLFVVYISKIGFASDKAKLSGVQTDFRSFYLATRAVVAEGNLNDIKVSGKFEEALNKDLEDSLRFTSGTCKDSSPFETPYRLITRNVTDGLEVLFYTDTTKNATVYYSGLDLKKSLDNSIDLSNKAAWGCKLTANHIEDLSQTEAAEIRNPGPVPSNVTDYYTYAGGQVSLNPAFKLALESNSGLGTAYKDWTPGSPLPNPGSIYNSQPVTSMEVMFKQLQAKTLDLSNFDTSNVTNMHSMFWESQAASIDLSSFNTSNVTDMSYMFYHSQAATLNLGSFDTSKVTNMDSMFGSSQATSIILSSFNTSNVTNMSYMFGFSKLTSLDLSNFDTSKVTTMYWMFYYSQAASLDLSNFNTSKVTNMDSMFSGSQAVSLVLSSFNTSNVITMKGMFYKSKVVSLDLSSFDTSKVTDVSGIFYLASTTTTYVRTQADADKFNTSSSKPSTLTFIVKP